MITRRNFVAGLATLLAAPAIVRVSSLMQLRSTPLVVPPRDYITLIEYASPPYGRSPVMDIMLEIRQLNELISKAYAVPPEMLTARGTDFHRGSTDLTAKRAELRQFALA